MGFYSSVKTIHYSENSLILYVGVELPEPLEMAPFLVLLLEQIPTYGKKMCCNLTIWLYLCYKCVEVQKWSELHGTVDLQSREVKLI